MKADAIFLLIMLATVIIGYKRGLIKSVLSLFFIVFSTFGAFLIYPFISDILKDTAFYTTVYERVSLSFTDKYNAMADTSEILKLFAKYNVDTLPDLISSASISVTNVITDVFSAILAFALVRIVMVVLKGIFGFISKLPVISGIDGILGAVFSLFSVMIVIFLFFAVILTPPCNESELSTKICEEIENSTITRKVMDYNFFVNYESLTDFENIGNSKGQDGIWWIK